MENEMRVCIKTTTTSHVQASELGGNILYFCSLEDSLFASSIQMGKYHDTDFFFFFQESHFFSLGKKKYRFYFL